MKKKHPKDMTTEEAITHLFHPKVVEQLKKHVKEFSEEKPKRAKKVPK